MDRWRRITGLVILGVIVGLILYDLAVYAFVGNDATLSRVLLGTSGMHPTFALCFAFAMGGLTVHLFGLNQTP